MWKADSNQFTSLKLDKPERWLDVAYTSIAFHYTLFSNKTPHQNNIQQVFNHCQNWQL